MEFITINGTPRPVPAELFSRPHSRSEIARWAKNPDAVEAELQAAAPADPEPAAAESEDVPAEATSASRRARPAATPSTKPKE